MQNVLRSLGIVLLGLVPFGCSAKKDAECQAAWCGNPTASASSNDAGATQSDAGVGDANAAFDGDAAETSSGMPAGYTQVAYLSTMPERSFPSGPTQVVQPGTDYIAVIDSDVGRMVLDLYEDDTPKTVNSFVFLSLHHFYEQVAFHRVIDKFMAQTGDPNTVSGRPSSWGSGGPGYQYGLEVKSSLNFDAPGVLGMARTSDPNSNGSQFFIMFNDYPSLNQQYTVWGKVIDGLAVLSKIVQGEPPTTPTRMTEVRIGTKAK